MIRKGGDYRQLFSISGFAKAEINIPYEHKWQTLSKALSTAGTPWKIKDFGPAPTPRSSDVAILNVITKHFHSKGIADATVVFPFRTPGLISTEGIKYDSFCVKCDPGIISAAASIPELLDIYVKAFQADVILIDSYSGRRFLRNVDITWWGGIKDSPPSSRYLNLWGGSYLSPTFYISNSHCDILLGRTGDEFATFMSRNGVDVRRRPEGVLILGAQDIIPELPDEEYGNIVKRHMQLMNEQCRVKDAF